MVRKGNIIGGVVLIILGVLFVLKNYFNLQISVKHIWPFILILIGILMLTGVIGRGKK